MFNHEPSGHPLMQAGERFAGHVIAIVAGIVLMAVGLALGVTIALLPVGLPLGLVGIFLLLWGFFSRAEDRESRLELEAAARAAVQRTPPDLDDYMAEIRKQVCSRCVERPPGGPPCLPLGKRCGLELNLPSIVEAVHGVRSDSMEPYIEQFHDVVCSQCINRPTEQCPCPMEYLLGLAVQAIETVDRRHAMPVKMSST